MARWFLRMLSNEDVQLGAVAALSIAAMIWRATQVGEVGNIP